MLTMLMSIYMICLLCLSFGIIEQDVEIKNEVDEYVHRSAPINAVDSPLRTVDFRDDTGREALPAERIYSMCGASSPSASTYCSRCCHQLAA
jgi:hypothetical protein